MQEEMMSDFLVIGATKYALLHREVLIEWLCQEWLIEHWQMLTEKTKTEIRRSVEQEFASDYEQMQETSWPMVRRLWIGE